jgi:hypothetical protein
MKLQDKEVKNELKIGAWNYYKTPYCTMWGKYTSLNGENGKLTQLMLFDENKGIEGVRYSSHNFNIVEFDKMDGIHVIRIKLTNFISEGLLAERKEYLLHINLIQENEIKCIEKDGFHNAFKESEKIEFEIDLY